MYPSFLVAILYYKGLSPLYGHPQSAFVCAAHCLILTPTRTDKC